MAVSGIGSSNSIYGNRNIITGLASGMDTESMIENAVSGLKMKITTLQQQRERTVWQQDLYRSIISKLSAFSAKYTSYQSSTNLMSSSFFNNAVTVKTLGTNAANITASGRTSSNIEVIGVSQLAKAATYNVSAGQVEKPSVSGDYVDLNEKMELSNISGSMTLNYGSGRSFTLDFGDQEVYKDATMLAKAINDKLSGQTMNLSDGTQVKASERMGAQVIDGKVVLYDKASNNSVYISGATGDLKKNLGIEPGTGATSIDVSNKKLYKDDTTRLDYLKTQEMSFTVDGVTKKIKLDNLDNFADAKGEDGKALTAEQKVQQALQAKLDNAFGKGKVTVGANTNYDQQAKFTLEAAKGSTISVTGGAALGMSDSATSYISTSQTVGSVDAWKNIKWDELQQAKDSSGEPMVDANGKALYEFKINGVVVGNFNEDTEIGTIMNAINNSEDAGVNVTYSKTTNQFQFTSKIGGEAGDITIEGGLAAEMFGKVDPTAVDEEGNPKLPDGYTKGQDAKLMVSVNGQEMELQRSSNTFELDGLTLNLKGTFNYDNSIDKETGKVKGYGTSPDQRVSFEVSADADKIVDAIKSMVEDYNEMVTEIKKAYSTLPATKSNGAFGNYMPLTDEDKADMSESAIKQYEETAKQGILFGDSDLSSLYSRLTKAISMTGKDGAIMKEIGLEIAYSDGLSTLTLNESKLRATLESDPDKVRDLFTKSAENGASSDGLMTALKAPVDMYGQTTGGKGILVQLAGSPLSATTLYNNTIQRKLDNFDTQIEKWQDKITKQIDRYTSQFTRLEQLISQMNSQSSALSSFMGMNMGGGY